MYVSGPHVCLVSLEARRGGLDPLELDLQMVVSCYVGAVTDTQVVCENMLVTAQLSFQ